MSRNDGNSASVGQSKIDIVTRDGRVYIVFENDNGHVVSFDVGSEEEAFVKPEPEYDSGGSGCLWKLIIFFCIVVIVIILL